MRKGPTPAPAARRERPCALPASASRSSRATVSRSAGRAEGAARLASAAETLFRSRPMKPSPMTPPLDSAPAHDGPPAVELSGVNAWFGTQHVLREVDLAVAPGE